MEFSSSGRKNLLVFVILLLISFFLILGSKSKFAISLKEVNGTIFYPFRVVTKSIGHQTKNLFSIFSHKDDFKEELLQSKAEILKYKKELINLKWLKKDNESLRRVLNLRSRIEYGSIVAEVTGTDPQYGFSYLVLNKGRIDGVTENLPVIYFDKDQEVLLGIVKESSLFTSKVETYRSINFSAGVYLEKTRAQGVVEGLNSQNNFMKVLYLDKDTHVEIGEKVYTSSLSTLFPSNLLVGSIFSIDTTDKTRMTYQIYLKSSVNLSHVSEVFILKPKKKIKKK